MPASDSIAETVTRASDPDAPRQGSVGALRVVYPRALTQIVVLDDRPTVLGRRPAVEQGVRLEHPTVSRRHVEVTWSSAARSHAVADLGSHNGSRRNRVGLSSEPAQLRDGDVLRLGDVCLVYEREAPTASTAEQSSSVPSVRLDAVPGTSSAMMRLRAAMARAGPDPSPVLVTGETGTGKEWVARELHRLSKRRGELLAINCAALSPQLVESQLFGHARGAFTGAQSAHPGLFRAADGGSVLLDEIGELAPEIQAKLLRVLQEKDVLGVGETRAVQVDVRVIASTLRDLGRLAREGAFRLDLYARLSLWELTVPALRERRADLLDWLDRLALRWHATRSSAERRPPDLDADAVELVLTHDWPDNLRGVDRLVHRMCSTPSPGPVGGQAMKRLLGMDSLAVRPPGGGDRSGPREEPTGRAHDRSRGSEPPLPGAGSDAGGGPGTAHRAAARPRPDKPTAEELRALLDAHEGSIRAVARELGRERRQIYRWLDQYGLRRKP